MPVVDIKLNKQTFTLKYNNHSVHRIHFLLSQEMNISPQMIEITKEKDKKDRLVNYTARIRMPNRLILSDYEMFLPNNGPHSIFYDERCVHYHMIPYLNERDVYINTSIEVSFIVLPWKYRNPLSKLQLEVLRKKDDVLVTGRNECSVTNMPCFFTVPFGDYRFYSGKVNCVHIRFTPSKFLEHDTKYVARVIFKDLNNRHAACWSFTTRTSPGIFLDREFLWKDNACH